MSNQPVKKVIIVGGGTAGWMAAASVSKLIGNTVRVSVVESDEIGTVGVGEATIPSMITLHKLLNIDERDFMTSVQGTFKLGISFENWKNVNENYIHSFGFTGKDCWAAGFQHFWLKGKQQGLSSQFGDYCNELQAAKNNKFAVLPNNGMNYAFHMDAGLYAKYLRKIAEKHGCQRIEGKITEVQTNSDTGYIERLILEKGQTIDGDLFIDCSGFSGLLINKTLNTEYEDWTEFLPCDSAVAVQTGSIEEPIPYTRSIAREAGWQWRIPLQHRVGNGMVFCSKHLSDDQAIQTLLDNVDGEVLSTPRIIKFTTGQRRQHWNKNCIALGLAAGFLEPLESTSIHLIQRGIIRLLQMFPTQGINQSDMDEFNAQMREEFLFVRDFIVLHYHVTERDDTPFWRQCRDMKIPETLQHRIDLFKDSGRIFQKDNDIFTENSWSQVMLGQGLMPEEFHPIVNMMTDKELENFLNSIKASVNNLVDQLPSHQQFINSYCKAEKI